MHPRFRNRTEDVVHWIEKVCMVVVGHDHRSRSPWCRAKHVDLKIHMPDGTDLLGARVLS